MEQPIIFHSLRVSIDPSPLYNIKTQVKKRQELIRIYEALKDLSQKYKFSSMEYSNAISHLNLVGISTYDKNNKITAYIECIDDSNSTKYKEILPHGFMKLKLRLLKSMKKPLLVVRKTLYININKGTYFIVNN